MGKTLPPKELHPYSLSRLKPIQHLVAKPGKGNQEQDRRIKGGYTDAGADRQEPAGTEPPEISLEGKELTRSNNGIGMSAR